MDIAHFEWKEEYSVKVKLFDEQHQILIKTIDDLFQSILKSEGKEVLTKIFADLNDYADIHFTAEQKYFQEFDYPEASAHTALHENFKKDLLTMETQTADENTPFKVLFYLENWWINHIMDTDKKYSEFFNKHGLS